MNIMEHTENNIETQITLLRPLLKAFVISKMRLWHDDEKLKENVVDNIGIRCINLGKTNVLYVKKKLQIHGH